MENEKIYQEFIEVSNKLSELTQKKKVLSEMVMQKFKEEKLDKIEAPNGLITKVVRSTWQYPDEVKKVMIETQKQAQETGVAKKVETEFLKTTLR